MKRYLRLCLALSTAFLLAACSSAEDGALSTDARKSPKVGHMTGSFTIVLDGVKYTGAVNLRCEPKRKGNGDTLHIGWPGNSWHMGRVPLRDVTCEKIADPSPPKADFNVFKATAEGLLNGELATEVRFTFIDRGEPGRQDSVAFTVHDASGKMLLAAPERQLTDGANLQAHFGSDKGDEDDGDEGDDEGGMN